MLSRALWRMSSGAAGRHVTSRPGIARETSRFMRVVASGLAACSFGVLLGSGPAMAHPPTTTGAEVSFSGNPQCSMIPELEGKFAFSFRIDPPIPGSYTTPEGLQVTFTLTDDPVLGQLLSWTKDNTGFVINGVIVKGSDGGNSYLYENQPPLVDQDSGLHAKIAGGSGKYAKVSHVDFCYSETETEFEGCTLGYWKNHPESWQGYSTGALVSSVFTVSQSIVGADTLLTALRYKGGPTLAHKSRLLLKQAVAAILSAAHPDVAYALTAQQVIDQVNAAIASGDETTILTLQQELNALNNAGCPLD